MVASGHAIVAADGDRLVAMTTGGGPVSLVSAVPGMVRHVATAPDTGTAYVVDRRGADTVVALTPHGTLTFPQTGEATHPTWSSRGDLAWSVGTGLRVRTADGGGVRRIPTPVPGGRLFSPVFRSPRSVVAVLSSPPSAAVPEDERLNNLWRYDLPTGRWHRVTGFTAGSDRWTAVRTPIRRGDGSLEFVTITGRGSATHEPRFALWSLTGGAARELRTLPGERYLAGEMGGDRLWNVPDPRTCFHHPPRGRRWPVDVDRVRFGDDRPARCHRPRPPFRARAVHAAARALAGPRRPIDRVAGAPDRGGHPGRRLPGPGQGGGGRRADRGRVRGVRARIGGGRRLGAERDASGGPSVPCCGWTPAPTSCAP